MSDKKRLMNTVFPSLLFKDSKKAIEFYSIVFNAVEVYRYEIDGRVMHAEIVIDSSKTSPSSIMLGDEMPDMKYTITNGGKGLGINLYIYVDDVDNVFNLAINNGSKSIYPPIDYFYGDRVGTFIDPFGYQWSVAKHVKDVSLDQMYMGQKKQEMEMSQMSHICDITRDNSTNNSANNSSQDFYRQKLIKYQNKYDDLVAKINDQTN